MDAQITPEELYRLLTGRAAEVMAQRIRDEVPAHGNFGQLSVHFDIPQTDKMAVLLTSRSLTGPADYCRLQVGAMQKDSNRLVSNYLLNDTSENLAEYLEREDIVDELLPYFKRLSDSVDRD